MRIKDFFLALLVVIIWGINFTVIKLGVGQMPPMFLVSLRFLLASFPAIFFVKKPDISWFYIITYGLAVGVGQFSCLFYAIKIGMPAGVSSVILQSQAFFTILFAGFFYKEKIKKHQVLGLLIASLGLFFIASPSNSGEIPLNGFLLTILAAIFWAISNIIVSQISKEAEEKKKTINMLSLVVWSSLAPPLPMLGLALVFDSPQRLWMALQGINLVSIFAIFYLSFLATLVGYGLWSILVSRYPASKVAPLSLLVPVFGLVTSQIILHERLSIYQWLGCGIIILGLLISNFTGYLQKKNP